MSFGPNPWHQSSWDARAAGNFMAGGAGSGLIVAAALGGGPAWLFLAGAAIVGIGLLCVWAEIGRPWRALNVFFHPRTSWMTREAIVAPALMLLALAAALGVGAAAWGLHWWRWPSSTARAASCAPHSASRPGASRRSCR